MTRPQITVIGDVMLDIWHWVSTTRSNPESTGDVYLIDRTDYGPGGAASVAMLARYLGAAHARVLLAGLTGRDAAADHLAGLLAYHGVENGTLAQAHRPTTIKTRHRLLPAGYLLPDRFDCEDHTPAPAEYLAHVPIGDALILQDHAKGTLANGLPALIARARDAGAVVLVDPAPGRPWQDYAGADVIKANAAEARAAARTRYEYQAPLPDIVAHLATAHNCLVVVTDGSAGIWHARPKSGVHYTPAPDAGPVMDPTGCGDTVLAALAVQLSRGVDPAPAVAYAALGAARQSTRYNVVPVTI